MSVSSATSPRNPADGAGAARGGDVQIMTETARRSSRNSSETLDFTIRGRDYQLCVASTRREREAAYSLVFKDLRTAEQRYRQNYAHKPHPNLFDFFIFFKNEGRIL